MLQVETNCPDHYIGILENYSFLADQPLSLAAARLLLEPVFALPVLPIKVELSVVRKTGCDAIKDTYI